MGRWLNVYSCHVQNGQQNLSIILVNSTDIADVFQDYKNLVKSPSLQGTGTAWPAHPNNNNNNNKVVKGGISSKTIF